MTIGSVSVKLINTCKDTVWQIISPSTVNYTLALTGSVETCMGIVWQFISASTLNCAVVFWHRTIDSGTVYMYHSSVAQYVNQHINEYWCCAKSYQKI